MRLVELTALLTGGVLAGAAASSARSTAQLPSRAPQSHVLGGTTEDTAARVALFVLRASALGTHGPVGQYIMLPSIAGLDETGAINALIALGKPAQCSAWQEGTALWLTCWSHDQIPDLSFIDGMTAIQQQEVEYLKKAVGGKTHLKIIVQDSLSRLAITDAQYGRFLSEYFVVPASHGTTIGDPRSDADAVAHFGRSQSLKANSP